jgi:hypothetical protein
MTIARKDMAGEKQEGGKQHGKGGSEEMTITRKDMAGENQRARSSTAKVAGTHGGQPSGPQASHLGELRLKLEKQGTSLISPGECGGEGEEQLTTLMEGWPGLPV